MFLKCLSSFFLFCFTGLAFAAEGGVMGAEGGAGGLMGSMVPLVLFAVAFYFLLIRPQSKRQKEHRNLVSKLTKGDEVIVAGGILGTIDKVSDQFVVVSVSNSTHVTVQRQAVSQVLPKGTIQSI